MNVLHFDELKNLGIQVKDRGGNQQKTTCPKCSHTRKPQNQKDTCLSVNLEEGLYRCHNCDFAGSVKKGKKREYSKPLLPEYKFGEKVREWFENRKISPYTLQRYQISSAKKYIKKVEEQRECILFPYFRNGELVNVKYRDAAKNFSLTSGAELIFFGMDIAQEASENEVVITEGEIDAMSFFEAGVRNVISVPNGASKGNLAMEYLGNCWKWFEEKTKIIIATDNDDAGKSLRDELVRRFGSDRCWLIDFFDYKDANEVLQKMGAEYLKTLYNAARPCPIKGIVTIEDFEEELDDLYEQGYKVADGIGFKEFDDLIRWNGGELTIVSGTPGSGKSNFIDQNLVLMAAKHGKKFGFFSPEYKLAFHASKIESIFIGKPFYKYDDKITPDQHLLAKIFIKEHFVFLKYEDLDDITVDGLLEKCREMILRYGINGFVIDPWNYVEEMYGDGVSETQKTGVSLTKIKRFKDKYGLHIWVIAHPKKMNKVGDEYEVVKPYDINGSAHFFNKADNCLSVWRNFKTNEVQVYTQKIRYNWVGKIGSASFLYDHKTGRYKESGDQVFMQPVKYFLDRHELPNIYEFEDERVPPYNPNSHIEPKKDIEIEEPLPW